MSVPRWLRVARDYPRATTWHGRPSLDLGERKVPLRPYFPRQRTVSCGESYQSLAWLTRTAQHRNLHQRPIDDRGPF